MSVVLSEHLPLLATAPDGIQKLRGLILELAVRGKLVPQDPNDEPASQLLTRIAQERARLEAEGICKKSKPMPLVGDDERPFALPDGWEWTRLSESLAVVTDGDHLPPPKAESGVPFLVIGNMNTGRITFDECRFVPPTYFDQLDWSRRPSVGDLLYTVTGSFGIAVPVETDARFCVQRHVAILKRVSSSPTAYLLQYLQAPCSKAYAEAVATGIAQKTVTLGALRQMPIALPPLTEQHRIVAKVDGLMALCDRLGAEQADAEAAHAELVDTLLSTLTQSIDAADLAANWQRLAEHFDTLFTTESSFDTLKQTILQLAVMGKLVPQDPQDEPASELLKRIEQERARLEAEGGYKQTKSASPLIEDEKPFSLPCGWRWTKVCAVFNTTSGNTFDGGLEKEQGAVAYVKVGDMNLRGNELHITTSSRFINPDPQMERWLIPTGSIIFPKRGGAIATNKKRIVRKPIFVDLNTMAISPILGVETAYAYLWLSTIDLASLNTGTSVPQINHKDIDPLPFPLPPLAEQHRIVAKVDKLVTLCDRLKADLVESRAHQDRLASTLIESALQAA